MISPKCRCAEQEKSRVLPVFYAKYSRQNIEVNQKKYSNI
ncbi:hypothetical protein GCWU000341_01868 [Oribacterium sp. oral taxon 078 str. F0262]|nr:hypothetical protein GCWU000341_01868 [Oribacterium sp. oral taxon 078 str. F0262]